MAVALREVRSSKADVAWRPRPAVSLCVRLAALAAPIVVAFLTALLLARLFPPPDGGAVWIWRVLVIGVSTAVSMVAERRLRKLVSLSTLLKLSLVFPDHAPPRYSVALRTGTTQQLRKQLLDPHEPNTALDLDAQAAATHLLELVGALNSHDRLTRGHSERVRAYARMIGEELELSPHDLAMLNWSALLHDIGKLEVSAETLSWPGKLNDEQWEEIKRHPEAGYRLVAPLRVWLGRWADAVRDHHERWEGGGYPAGISGGDISLGGRIVAVADAFDVMTSPRSYKKPCSAAAAREELQRCAGTQFDPDVVRAFLNVSIGRLRSVIGPLAWLAELPLLGQLQVGAIATNTAPVISAAVLTAGSWLGIGPAAASTTADASTSSASPASVSPSGGSSPHGAPSTSGRGATTETGTDETSPGTSQPPVDRDGDGIVDPVIPGTVPSTTTSSVPNRPGLGGTPTTAAPPGATTTTTAATTTTTTTLPSHTFVANDDSATLLLLNHSVVIDVVANDHDEFDHDISIVSVSTPQLGTATIIPSGKYGRIRYTSNALLGNDTFTYTIRCEDGEVATATVRVTIIL